MQQKNIFTGKYTVPVLAILACILWGTAFPFLKISYEKLMITGTDFFPRMLFAAYRFLIASLILFAFQFLNRGWDKLKINKSDLGVLCLLGLLQTTLQYFFFYNGLANTSGVKGSILNTTGIFLTVILAHFTYHNDRLDFRKSLGLLFGLLGVIIVNINRGSFSFTFHLLGEGFIIMSAVVSTLASFLAKRISKRLDIVLITAYQMFFGAVMLYFISLIKVKPASLQFTPLTLTIMIYLSLVSATAFGLWYTLIKYNPLGYVSIYKFVVPVSGVLFSTLLLVEERISLNILIALFFVSLGIIMINFRKQRSISVGKV